jgi:Na+-transporting NADH:ubiquinone oxidoreductase subunit B
MADSRVRRFLDRLHPLFAKGGRFENFYALYEMVDTFLYSPPDTTRTAPHGRDAIDLKRLMSYVVLSLTPCILMGWYNTGYQANLAIVNMGLGEAEGWRGIILNMFTSYEPTNPPITTLPFMAGVM